MWEPDSKKNTQMDRFRAAVGAASGLALGECRHAARGLRGHHRLSTHPPRPAPGRGLGVRGAPWQGDSPPWGPGRRLLRGVAVRAPAARWNNPLILSFPVPGLGGATGIVGAPSPGRGALCDGGVCPLVCAGVFLTVASMSLGGGSMSLGGVPTCPRFPTCPPPPPRLGTPGD